MLRLLLVSAMGIAPFITGQLLLDSPKAYRVFHFTAWIVTSIALFCDVAQLSFVWMLFCLYGLGLFVKQTFPPNSVSKFVTSVPFIFSVVGSLWLVSGANDFRLLQYGEAFSYYAALHSHVLGWIMIGAIAAMATHSSKYQRCYTLCVFVSLASFFFIAFGIDGATALKPFGVFGITLAIGGAQLLFLIDSETNGAAFGFGLVGLLGFALTIFLAWQNEIGIAHVGAFLGVRPMVSIHGAINCFIVGPATLLALHFRFRIR